MNNETNLLESQAGSVLAGILQPNKSEAPAKYRLSQSLTKELLDTSDCPLRVKTHSIDGSFKRPESEVLIKGQLFEYLAMGSTNREGNVPVLQYVKKTRKNPQGRMSTDEVRIREQAAIFWQQMEDWGVEIIGRDVKIAYRYSDELMVDGIIDARARIHGKPFILDIKLTGDLNSTFGFYGFGDFHNMDKIQADMYCMIEERNYGFRPGFAYAVFDYKPVPERKLFIVEEDFVRQARLHERLEEALDTIKRRDREGWPVNPSPLVCQSKCGNLSCLYRMEKPVKPVAEKTS